MRSDDGRVIPTFIWRALRNEDIPIYGNGAQTQSFCYISDMIDGIIKMMDFEDFCPINLGNSNEEISILFLAEKIKEMTSSMFEIIFLPNCIDDPSKRRPDISKAQELLNWQPEYDLNKGLPFESFDNQEKRVVQKLIGNSLLSFEPEINAEVSE